MNSDLEQLKHIVGVNEKIKYYDLLLNKKTPKKYNISVIIPVRDRLSFLAPLVSSLKNAIKKSNNKINITIVEHSTNNLFRKDSKVLGLNYYWINSKTDEPFNKCLCHNVGAILNKNSDSYLFHDLDCLVFDDFFITINNDITEKNAKAIQTFKNRRLLYLNEDLTNKIIDKKLEIKDIPIDMLTEGESGAPGGSILINKNLFFDIGGFDPELFFGYAPEDTFFWAKMELFSPVYSSSNEILHMYHKTMNGTNDKINEMKDFFEKFNSMPKEDKFEFINIKKNLIIKYGIV